MSSAGHDYADGTGVIKDEVEAFKLYKQAADQGHVGAICSLGEFLFFFIFNILKELNC